MVVALPVESDKVVEIYTDGACSGNPGPGGYGAILTYKGHKREIQGYSSYTTNNRMELLGAIRALEALKYPCRVRIYVDSQYLKNGITNWIHSWIKNGWRKKDHQLIKNADLWKRLWDLIKVHDVEWSWVKGHSGHSMNERADELARTAISLGERGTLKEDQAGRLPT